MSILRYTASADTTITNAFEFDMKTRGTGSNMGASDSLEVFSIYNQVSSSTSGKSAELSRVLVNFPISTIESDRTAGTLPAFGKVNFYLRMFNAEHASTTPAQFTLTASAVTTDWEEGFGLDMESYKDLTRDGEGANWINSRALNAATATFTFTNTGNAAGTYADEATITITDAGDVAKTYKIMTGFDANAANQEFNTGATDEAAAANFKQIVESANGHNGTILVTVDGGTVTMTQSVTGTRGLKDITVSSSPDWNANTSTNVGTAFSLASLWTRTGGDYDFHPDSSFHQSFETGREDLELDITPLVEQWLNSAGNTYGNKSSARYGVGVFLTGTQEAHHDEADSGGVLKNLSGSARSYYTKKFFARGSEFFFKRPLIEARWDSSRKDNRSNFYFSSSIAPGEDNLNTIYLYNYVRGQLKNIPGVGTTGSILVSIYSGSADNTAALETAQQKLWNPYNVEPTAGGAHVLNITGSYVSTGIYSASFALTGTSGLTTIYDVWHSGTFANPHVHQYFTGAISTNDFNSSEIDPNANYVMNMKNLRPIYSDKETARFRLFTRKKDWSPTIYTKATKNIKTDIIEDVYYKIFRVKDNHTIIDYGTGSLNHTRLSYDVSGSYFDLDMSILQNDYMYGIKLVAYENGKYTEQPDIFKFRVE